MYRVEVFWDGLKELWHEDQWAVGVGGGAWNRTVEF
jgi:hypothetical protein